MTTRKEFIEKLRQELSGLPHSEREEIIRDQEEYISDAIQAGRNEAQVISSLGEPKVFAASLNATAKIEKASASATLKQQAGNTFHAVFAVLALAPFNVIFVLGPFITLVCLIGAGWITSCAVTFSSIIAVVAFLIKCIVMPAGVIHFISSLLFLVGVFGLSLLGLFAMYFVSQFFIRVTLKYLQWNLNFVTKS